MKIELRATVTTDDGNQSQCALHVDSVEPTYRAVSDAINSMAERIRRTVVANSTPEWDGVARARPGN